MQYIEQKNEKNLYHYFVGIPVLEIHFSTRTTLVQVGNQNIRHFISNVEKINL